MDPYPRLRIKVLRDIGCRRLSRVVRGLGMVVTRLILGQNSVPSFGDKSKGDDLKLSTFETGLKSVLKSDTFPRRGKRFLRFLG